MFPSVDFLHCQVASGCAVGAPAGLRVAVAPGGPRPSRCSLLWPRRGAVRPVWSAGAPGRAPLGPRSGSHVCAIEGGG